MMLDAMSSSGMKSGNTLRLLQIPVAALTLCWPFVACFPIFDPMLGDLVFRVMPSNLKIVTGLSAERPSRRFYFSKQILLLRSSRSGWSLCLSFAGLCGQYASRSRAMSAPFAADPSGRAT